VHKKTAATKRSLSKQYRTHSQIFIVVRLIRNFREKHIKINAGTVCCQPKLKDVSRLRKNDGPRSLTVKAGDSFFLSLLLHTLRSPV